jgi:hypothetical protein
MLTPAAIRQRRSRRNRQGRAPFVCVGCGMGGDDCPRSTSDRKLCAVCAAALSASGMRRCRDCADLTTNARYCTACNRKRWANRPANKGTNE